MTTKEKKLMELESRAKELYNDFNKFVDEYRGQLNKDEIKRTWGIIEDFAYMYSDELYLIKEKL